MSIPSLGGEIWRLIERCAADLPPCTPAELEQLETVADALRTRIRLERERRGELSSTTPPRSVNHWPLLLSVIAAAFVLGMMAGAAIGR